MASAVALLLHGTSPIKLDVSGLRVVLRAATPKKRKKQHQGSSPAGGPASAASADAVATAQSGTQAGAGHVHASASAPHGHGTAKPTAEVKPPVKLPSRLRKVMRGLTVSITDISLFHSSAGLAVSTPSITLAGSAAEDTQVQGVAVEGVAGDPWAAAVALEVKPLVVRTVAPTEGEHCIL